MRSLCCTFALFCATPSFATTLWSWNLSGGAYITGTGTFSATESTTGTSISGTFSRVSSGFVSLNVTGCTGGECPLATNQLYALEVPGLSLMIQPVLTKSSVETQIIYSVAAGSCPAYDFDGNWVFSQWNNGVLNDTTSPSQAAFGTVSWSTSASRLDITGVRNLADFGALSVPASSLSGTCSSGQMPVSGSGDRGGTIYLTSYGAALFRTNGNHAIWIVPKTYIDYPQLLSGKYAGFRYDSSSTEVIKTMNMTIDASGSSVPGNALSDTSAGTIDPSFAETISIQSTNSPSNGFVTGTITRSGVTGKIVCEVLLNVWGQNTLFCAGQSPDVNSQPYNLMLVSLNQAPSTLDTNFGPSSAGTLTASVGSANAFGRAMALHRDGRVVVAGYANDGANNDFAALRLKVDGTVDTTFNGNGNVMTPIGNASAQALAVAVQSDQKVVLAGYASNGSNQDFAVVRYLEDGSLDSSFNGTGKVTIAIGSGDDIATAVVIQPNGKIIVGGYSAVPAAQNVFAVARLNSDGSSDYTFNTTGIATFTLTGATSNVQAQAIAVQPDGSVVQAGFGTFSSQNDFVLVRYTSDGGPDNGFGTNGVVVTNVRADDYAYAVALQADGKIVAGGYASDVGGSNWDFALARYTTSGNLDNTFNSPNGTVTAMVQATISDDIGKSLVIQPDGKILLGGYWNSRLVGSIYMFALARFTTAGALDTDFNGTGTVTAALGSSDAFILGMAAQADGKVVAAGYSTNGTYNQFAVARFNSNVTSGTLMISDGESKDFGSVSAGGVATATLTVRNTGGASLSSLAPSAPPLKPPFTFFGGSYPGTGGTCGSSLAAGASCTVVISFSPTQGGTYSGLMTLGYSDGTAAWQATRGLMGSSPAAELALDSAAYDFGNYLSGGAADRTITVTNRGNLGATSIAIGSPALTSPFTIKGGSYPGTGGTCGVSLAVGASCTIVVTFSPSAVGSYSSVLALSYSDANATRSALANLKGAVPSASVTLSDSSYSFGSVVRTSSGEKTFTVSNILAVTSVTGLGAGSPAMAAPFAFKGGSYPGTGGTCGTVLSGMISCTVVVTFSPTQKKSYSDTLRITYNDGTAHTLSVALTGVGN